VLLFEIRHCLQFWFQQGGFFWLAMPLSFWLLFLVIWLAGAFFLVRCIARFFFSGSACCGVAGWPAGTVFLRGRVCRASDGQQR
jgi:hypothetical protein